MFFFASGRYVGMARWRVWRLCPRRLFLHCLRKKPCQDNCNKRQREIHGTKGLGDNFCNYDPCYNQKDDANEPKNSELHSLNLFATNLRTDHIVTACPTTFRMAAETLSSTGPRAYRCIKNHDARDTRRMMEAIMLNCVFLLTREGSHIMPRKASILSHALVQKGHWDPYGRAYRMLTFYEKNQEWHSPT